MNVTANRVLKVSSVKKKNVLMIVRVMEYVRIINAYVLMAISETIALFTNVQITAQNTVNVTVKLANALVTQASLEMIALKRTALIIAQEKVYAIMKLDFVNVRMDGIMMIVLIKLVPKTAPVMVYVWMENANVGMIGLVLTALIRGVRIIAIIVEFV